ncbi:MAG: TonB-dependent receptor [Desulfuromonadales bacterium]|nr:TonB-dependent receptor [Desulfuromonadales bacterium]
MFSPVSRGIAGCLLLIGLTAPFPAVAEEPATPPPAEMETVTVTGQAEDLLSGASILAGETLQQLPLKNGSIAETITILPHVQAGEAQRTSERGGEILPPLISISGARPYENYFSVDGVGLNSRLDPLANDIFDLDSVPGHPQRTFIHRDLIESIEVYDSNIPARYGQFLGGVIDAKTRNPGKSIGGTLRYRTTRDEWAEQHVDASREEDFDNSRYSDQQPDYRKHDGGVEIDMPLNESMGLLAAYNHLQSTIELSHIGEDRSQDKKLDNFFLKYLWTPDATSSLELTGTYTPSEEDFFYEDTKDSDLTVKRGGYALNANYATRLSGGDLTMTAAYLENENSRTAPPTYYSWLKTPSRNWGTLLGTTRSLEGGFGDLDTSENSLQFKADYLFDPVPLGTVTHTLNVGIAYTRDEGEYDRQEAAYLYNSTVASTAKAPVVCLDGDPTCISGEQYFNARNIYPEGSASAVIHQQAYYVEDLVSFGRFTLRPGVRVSHDDFLDNMDFAHRLAGSWDLFGNGATLLLAGHNRYFGEALLTYKLREAIAPATRQTRKFSNESWPENLTGTPVSTTLNKFSELDTPFSDEFTVGVEQKLLGGTLSLNYLDRRHRDQFAKETITENGKKYFVLNNNGSSNYESWSIGWERQWRKHYLNINYSYAESTNNMTRTTTDEDYDENLSDVEADTLVWYDGKYVNKEDLPRVDYYRPHVLNVVYVGKLPYGLTFTNITKYQSGYEAIDTLTTTEKKALDIPTSVTAYEKDRRSGACIFDWRIDWENKIYRDQSMILSLEINNVFDRKVKVGSDGDDIYELGREFWLGMSYKF